MAAKKLQGLSLRAYASHRGVTHTAVGKAVRSGRISTLPDGSIDPAVADAQWAQNTDVTKSSNSVTGQPRHRRRPGEPPSPAEDRAAGPGPDPSGAGGGYTRARGAREGYTALLTKLRYENELGARVPVEEVRQGAYAAGKKHQGAILSMPEQLAGEVAGRTRDECYEILRAWAVRACEDLLVPAERPA